MDRSEDLEDLLRAHEEGAFRLEEVTIRLCQLAAEDPPQRLAPSIPPDLLDEVRRRFEAPPEDPQEVGVYYLLRPTGHGDPGWDGQIREESRRFYDGMWRWHRYFSGA
ncbi:MAG TPA: hypothetical protein VGH33_12400 [Isosphaeraceae bacterium]